MMAGVAAGGALGLGLWFMIRGWFPATPSLQRELEAFHRPRTVASGSGIDAVVQRWSWQVLYLVEGDSTGLERDVAVVGTTMERHALERFLLAAVGAAFPVAVAAVALAATGTVLSPLLTGLAALALGAGGYFGPSVVLRSNAEQRRKEFVTALTAYVRVVTLILAGGGGVATALTQASKESDSWPFLRLREVLAETRMSGESPWTALNRLGADLGVAELSGLASSIALAGDSGARVRESLEAKAATMRNHELAAAEAVANSRSELMAGPTFVMLVALMLLLMFPAMVNVMTLQ
jgi:tight adherence protein C